MTNVINLSVADVIAAWPAESDRRQAWDEAAAKRGMAFSDAALALLAEGKPASQSAIARRSGLPAVEVSKLLAEIEARGGEVDEAGNLVGPCF